MRFFLFILFACLGLASGVRQAAAAEDREYLIVVGGVSLWQWEKYKSAPHDNWWMNFVRAARIRTEQIRAERPGTPVTWLVYRSAYVTRSKQDDKDLLGFINSVPEAFQVKLVYFDKSRQMIDYLNAGRPRDRVKIAGLEYFGHSNKACWLFDYSNNVDSASKVWLHETELGQIQRGIFAPQAFAKSWGCHTGESMSRKFRQATGIPLEGAVGKTEYQTDELPRLSSEGGYWTR
jgi:hypothetical protein